MIVNPESKVEVDRQESFFGQIFADDKRVVARSNVAMKEEAIGRIIWTLSLYIVSQSFQYALDIFRVYSCCPLN